jgi:hypothetical protein
MYEKNTVNEVKRKGLPEDSWKNLIFLREILSYLNNIQ